jgi:hypothetical protein
MVRTAFLLLATAASACAFGIANTGRDLGDAATPAKSLHAPRIARNTASIGRPEDAEKTWCSVFHTKEPPTEDPLLACWPVNNDALNEEIEYICVHEHPCLDIDDGFDHSEDSY